MEKTDCMELITFYSTQLVEIENAFKELEKNRQDLEKVKQWTIEQQEQVQARYNKLNELD